MPRVAIIIVNFNSSHYTLACIRSIVEKSKDPVGYEIVVVDNASRKDDLVILEKEIKYYPQTKLITSNLNLGFAAGNMLGVQHANNSDYYYFLNNDCELMNDVIGILTHFMQQTPAAIWCTGQMHDSNQQAVPSFGYYPCLSLLLFGSGTLRLFYPSAYPRRKKNYTSVQQVPLITGASLFIRASAFNEIGGFDTRHFLYCEEEDIAIRLSQLGLCYLVPEAEFIHHGGKSTSRNYLIEREFYISLLYYYRKHNPFNYPVLCVLHAFKLLMKVYKKHYWINFKLAFFILAGAPMRYSLYHQQRIQTTS